MNAKTKDKLLGVISFVGLTAYFIYGRYQTEQGLNLYGVIAALIVGYVGTIFVMFGDFKRRMPTREEVVSNRNPIPWYLSPVLIIPLVMVLLFLSQKM